MTVGSPSQGASSKAGRTPAREAVADRLSSDPARVPTSWGSGLCIIASPWVWVGPGMGCHPFDDITSCKTVSVDRSWRFALQTGWRKQPTGCHWRSSWLGIRSWLQDLGVASCQQLTKSQGPQPPSCMKMNSANNPDLPGSKSSPVMPPDENAAQPTPLLQPCMILSTGLCWTTPKILTHGKKLWDNKCLLNICYY